MSSRKKVVAACSLCGAEIKVGEKMMSIDLHIEELKHNCSREGFRIGDSHFPVIPEFVPKPQRPHRTTDSAERMLPEPSTCGNSFARCTSIRLQHPEDDLRVASWSKGFTE